MVFKSARASRDAKRKELQALPDKRKRSAVALTENEYGKMVGSLNEDNPEGLQKKFFTIASFELAWRGGEGVKSLIHYFRTESDNFGNETRRIEYNPVFSKTAQGGAQHLEDSKWLVPNYEDSDLCPVR